MIARIVAIALLFALLLPASGTVRAQDQQCEAQPDFPSGWTVTTGNTSGNAVFGVHGTLPDGTGLNEGLVVTVEKDYGQLRSFGTIAFDYDFVVLFNTNDKPIVASFTILENGTPVANRTIRSAPVTSSGWTTGVNVSFAGETGDTLRVDLYHFTDTGQIGLRVNNACTYQVVTVTPSVLPSYTNTATASNTPVPSATSGPTPTPTYTLTPTLTVTPGGPSVTPIPSSATSPGVTPSTATLQGLVVGGSIFASVPAPKGCTDFNNPCGELPFAVPGFATLSIASPTRLPSNTPGGGFHTLTPGAGTPTGTPATATSGPSPTGTFTGNESGIVAFATRIVAGRTIVAFNATLTGPDGSTALDLRNSGNEIGSSIGFFFGAIRSLQSLFLGRAGQLIAFLLLCAGFVLVVKLTIFIIQVMLGLLKWVTRIVNALKL